MRDLWISILLLVSIALQSYAAVANTQATHQIDVQHLQTEHSHSADRRMLFDDLSDTLSDTLSDKDHSIKDCHHCGHCQGTHTPWVIGKRLDNFAIEFLTRNDYFYLGAQYKSFTEDPIRPPIA